MPGIATRSSFDYIRKYSSLNPKRLVDTGVNTNEALDAVETGIDCDIDATTAIPIGTVIRIDDEFMVVTATGTTLTVTRGAANSTAVTHNTGADIFKKQFAGEVLWLPGQQDPQSATIRDLSGYGNHGTITGATWVQESSGLWVNSFDGVDDYIDGSYGGSVAVLNQLPVTLMAWVYPIAAGENIGYDATILSSDVSGQYGQSLGFDANRQFVLEFHDGWLLSTSAYALNTWYFVVGVLTTTSQLISVNTVSNQAANASSITGGANGYVMGRFTLAGGGNFEGRTALARAVTYALTASQIAQIFQQERSFFGV